MKKFTSKLTLLAGAFVLAAFFTAPAVLAAAKDGSSSKADRKAKREAEILRKYDKNGNGKLDPDEEAAYKADREKAKSQRKRKKRGGSE